MSKQSFKPGNMIYPLPAVMVSCGDSIDNYNIITIGWTGTVCSEPPMCYISVRKSRHSHDIIKRTGCYVINLTTESLVRQTDWCGVKSGRDFNKFEACNLTPEPAPNIPTVMIKESPLSIECVVEEIKELGSHDMFISRVVGVHADEKFIDKKTGEFDLKKASLLVYNHGKYYSVGELLGFFGFSVQKTKKKK